VAAFNADAGTFALFTARLTPGQTGAGVTGALTETYAAAGYAFSNLALSDAGDHKNYQAAKGYRYWTTLTSVEKRVHGAGDWVNITSSCTVNMLTGKITLASALNSDDLVRATGIRRHENAFRKVANLYDGKLTINGKDIDTTSLEDSGWGSSIQGSRSWSISAGTFFYDGGVPITEIGTELYAKLYAIYSTSKSFVGIGAIQNMENLVANPNDAQRQTFTIKGDGEIYPE
jgi:hypothetical protein